MRNFCAYFLIAVFMFSIAHDASAKRFGGGRSFGSYRSHPVTSAATAQKAKATPQITSLNKGGILGGLLVGGFLASLFMSNGLGAGLLSWLVLGALGYFLIPFFRGRMQAHMQTVHSQSIPQNNYDNIPHYYRRSASAADQPLNSAPTFEIEPFLRGAKICFIRLQAAYDQKNMQDLAKFTSPVVFAEIKMQLDERGDEPNITEVVHLNAELLKVSEQANEKLASVRFTGQLRENNQLNELDEVWYFCQYASDSWIVASIEH